MPWSLRQSFKATRDSRELHSRFGRREDDAADMVRSGLGIKPQQTLTGAAPTSGRHIVGVEFTKAKAGQNREPIGPARLHVDEKTVAEAEIRTVEHRRRCHGEDRDSPSQN